MMAPATFHISAPPLTLREYAPVKMPEALKEIGVRLRRLRLRKWVEGILFANGFYVTNAVALVACDAIVDALDAGTAAVIEIYNGTAPADADAAESNTLLASLTMSATAFGSAADLAPGARATASAITSDSSADATGTATHFRVKTQTGGTVCMQGTVGTSSADLILNTVSITAGSTVAITAFTVTLPEGP